MRETILARGPDVRRVVLNSLVIGVPIFFLRVTLDPFNVPKLALLVVGVLVVLAIRLIEMTQGASGKGLEVLWVPAALLFVPLLTSWVLSPYRSWAVFGFQPRFEGIVPYLFVILFGILLCDAFRGRGAELAFALCWSGAVVGGYAVIQTIGMDPFEWSLFGAPTEAVSTTGNPNFTGGFLGIVLPVGLALAITDRERRRTIVRLTIPIVLGWVVARSQGGWAAGVAGCALVAGHLFSTRNRRARMLGIMLAGLVTLATVGVVLLAMVQPSGRFTPDGALVRARWWQAAVGMGWEHPLAGRGPNSFALEGVSHRPLEDALVFGFDFPDDPHSIPLAMFANLGLPGLLGFIGILGWTIWLFTRARAPSLLHVGFLGAVVAYFVQATVSIDELTLRIGLWVGLAGLAAFHAATGREQPSSKKTRVKKPAKRVARRSPLRSPAIVTVVALLTAVSLLWPASIIVADARARAGVSAFAAQDPEAGRHRLNSAISLRDSADYKARLAFELRDLALEESALEEYFVGAVRAFRSFIEEAPYVFSLVSYARLLDGAASAGSGSGDPEAVDILRRALEIDPLNPLIRAELATALLHLGRGPDAFAVLEPQIEIVPEGAFGAFWSALALAAAETGAEDVAHRAIANAEGTSPGSEFVKEAQRILDR